MGHSLGGAVDLPYDWAMILATDAQRHAPDPMWWDHTARRVIIDAGHLVHEARPEEFLGAVGEFLSPGDRTRS